MQIFKIKKNDNLPALVATFQYSNGSAVDLTGGNVIFNMGNLSDYSKYTSGACVLTDAVNGQCQYNWTGSIDTGSVGAYWGEFEAIWGGSRMTFPNDHSLQIQVFEDYK